MPSNFNKRMVRYPLYGLLAVSLALLVLIGFYHWWITVIGLLLLGALFYLAFFLEQKSNEETLDYISTLSYRIKTSR